MNENTCVSWKSLNLSSYRAASYYRIHGVRTHCLSISFFMLVVLCTMNRLLMAMSEQPCNANMYHPMLPG